MSALTEHDQACLKEALNLIGDVLRRHSRELNGPILSAVEVVSHDVALVERMIGSVTP